MQLALDLVADRLELESARQIEPLQIVRRVEIEAEQRVVDDLDAGLDDGRGAQMRGEALRSRSAAR